MKLHALIGGCLVLAVLFAGLGVWQLERRTWKLALIHRVEERIKAPASAVPPPLQWSRISAARDEYRRVQVRGVWLHDRETLVQAVTEEGPGWWVVTPLRSEVGTILINRGFVPPERRDRENRPEPTGNAEVVITGLLRLTEPHGGFLRANDAASDRWYSRDVAAIAAARHLGIVAPFFVDADARSNPGPYPKGGLTVVAFRNAHLAYALTWFGMSAMAIVGAWLFLREGKARRAGSRSPGDGTR